MVQKITKGIRVSVETGFEGTFFKDPVMSYAFAYRITITNQSQDTVQLNSRFWEIRDSLNHRQVVKGDGVIGLKPVLKPGESHSYSSGCVLQSPFGSMQGHYNMINIETTGRFKVQIPSFKLSAPFAQN